MELLPLAARISGVVSRFDVAETAAQTILSFPSAQLENVSMARIGLALMAVQRGDVFAAQEQYDALWSAQNTMVGYVISSDRLLVLSQLGFGNYLRKRLRLLPF